MSKSQQRKCPALNLHVNPELLDTKLQKHLLSTGAHVCSQMYVAQPAHKLISTGATTAALELNVMLLPVDVSIAL